MNEIRETLPVLRGTFPAFRPGTDVVDNPWKPEIADDMGLVGLVPSVDDRSHDPDESIKLSGPVYHGDRGNSLTTQTTPVEAALATENLDFFKP